MKFFVRIRSRKGNIASCILFNRACIISDVTQSIVLCFVLKNNIFGFSVVFSWKTVQIFIFKVEYLKIAVTDLNDFGLILQDF